MKLIACIMSVTIDTFGRSKQIYGSMCVQVFWNLNTIRLIKCVPLSSQQINRSRTRTMRYQSSDSNDVNGSGDLVSSNGFIVIFRNCRHINVRNLTHRSRQNWNYGLLFGLHFGTNVPLQLKSSNPVFSIDRLGLHRLFVCHKLNIHFRLVSFVFSFVFLLAAYGTPIPAANNAYTCLFACDTTIRYSINDKM